MKKRVITRTVLIFIATAMILLTTLPGAVKAQENFPGIEELQDKNMDYIEKLSEIVDEYPMFSYSYEMEDGKIKKVTVTGVEDDIDTKEIEVVLLNLQSNRNKLKNKANRMGVFYSVDESARYKEGREALNNALHENLKYPEDAKDWGVEGTIYVKFVVDENGQIPYATTANNIETTMDFYVTDLEQQAISAIKKTSGKWEPGKIDDVSVPSFVVLPVTFDLKKNPFIPFWL